MNEPIYYIGGSKGEVGKSKVCFALIDYLIGAGKNVLLLESDTANPDVFKAHLSHADDSLVCRQTDLDVPEGWIEMVNKINEFPDHAVVINSAARSNTGIEKYGAMLRETLDELNRNLVTFWVINRQRDSLELVRGFLNAFPDALIHICRNLYYGPPEKFELYNKSKSREIVEKKGRTLDFPDLADRVADKLYSGRKPIWVAFSELPIGDRAELRRWKNAYTEMFDSVLKGE
ncbi:protein mobD [Bilophila wadsworthia]|uniref:nucleotide-binding protein n=1 Tax=Bilophila wadsworthia TaxID=35833 RepID=UPI0026759820|nr:protein mobD [Bilophila wadsworthia]